MTNITISVQAARVLLSIVQQVQVPGAEGKIKAGNAQAELEKGLKALQDEMTENK